MLATSRDERSKERTGSDGVCVERALSARGMYAEGTIGTSRSEIETGARRKTGLLVRKSFTVLVTRAMTGYSKEGQGRHIGWSNFLHTRI